MRKSGASFWRMALPHFLKGWRAIRPWSPMLPWPPSHVEGFTSATPPSLFPPTPLRRLLVSLLLEMSITNTLSKRKCRISLTRERSQSSIFRATLETLCPLRGIELWKLSCAISPLMAATAWSLVPTFLSFRIFTGKRKLILPPFSFSPWSIPSISPAMGRVLSSTRACCTCCLNLLPRLLNFSIFPPSRVVAAALPRRPPAPLPPPSPRPAAATACASPRIQTP
ncbi:hypothetical protein KI387_042296, partial [Taxus chinensis]